MRISSNSAVRASQTTGTVLLGATVLIMASLMAAPPAQAQPRADFMQCYKIKDTFGKGTSKFTAMANVVPADAQFGATADCEIRVKGAEICVGARRFITDSGGAPTVGLGGPELDRKYVCYKVKCPSIETPTITQVTDPFGLRSIDKLNRKSQRLCVPAVLGTFTVTTTTTTTTTTLGGSYKYVFNTADSYTGNVGGPQGADTLCNQAAQDAGLPGLYFAWLGSTARIPKDSLTPGSGPFIMPDGTLVAEDIADLLDGDIENSIFQDQNGRVNGRSTWTGTKTDGTVDIGSSNCQGWHSDDETFQGLDGNGGASGMAWTQAGYLPCSFSNPIYCFQQ